MKYDHITEYYSITLPDGKVIFKAHRRDVLQICRIHLLIDGEPTDEEMFKAVHTMYASQFRTYKNSHDHLELALEYDAIVFDDDGNAKTCCPNCGREDVYLLKVIDDGCHFCFCDFCIDREEEHV